MFNQHPPHISAHVSTHAVPSAPSMSGQHTAAGPLNTSRAAPQHTGAASVPGAAPVSSAVLLRGRKTVDIAHNGMLYTLQATKLGKLILTK